jgi:hypothetical protein
MLPAREIFRNFPTAAMSMLRGSNRKTHAPATIYLTDTAICGPNVDFVIGILPNKNPAHRMKPLSVDRFVVIARRSYHPSQMVKAARRR